MFERVALVHYHEIGLKGRNRSTFERRLRDNLDAALVGLPVKPAERIASRLAVDVTRARGPRQRGRQRLAEIPGVVSVSPAYRTARDLAEMERAALLALAEVPDARTFRVEARRSNTDYPAQQHGDQPSRLGDHLRLSTGAAVDLTRPDATVYAEVVQGDVYVYSAAPAGCGRTAGRDRRPRRLAALGGHRLARRELAHDAARCRRRGRPLLGSAADQRRERAPRRRSSATCSQRTGGLGRIYVVPFGDLQREISLLAPPDLRVLLYRRLMFRVAEEIAVAEQAKALVTGESLGQVASQTLENIAPSTRQPRCPSCDRSSGATSTRSSPRHGASARTSFRPRTTTTAARCSCRVRPRPTPVSSRCSGQKPPLTCRGWWMTRSPG